MGFRMAAVPGTVGSDLVCLVKFFGIDRSGFVQVARSLAGQSWICETETGLESGKHLEAVSLLRHSTSDTIAGLWEC